MRVRVHAERHKAGEVRERVFTLLTCRDPEKEVRGSVRRMHFGPTK